MSNYLRIQFPHDFEERYRTYRARILGENNTTTEPPPENVPPTVTTYQHYPSCFSEKRLGYIRFKAEERPVEVGNESSQPYKLLYCLTNPVVGAKPLDFVFSNIEIERYENDQALHNPTRAKMRKRELIDYVMKEVQKILSAANMRKRASLRYDDFETAAAKVTLVIKY